MIKYPVLEINTKLILQNASILLNLCQRNDIFPCAVVKGFCNCEPITQQLIIAGFQMIASSRIPHLKDIKEAGFPVSTLLLRISMKCEIPDVIRYCDISLESERHTLSLLNEEAGKQGTVHKIILMKDLGDLREGIFSTEEFIKTALFVEYNCPNLFLYGTGANLACYGSVSPTYNNLSKLCHDTEQIEAKIKRSLNIISGGNTSSIPLIVNGQMPKRINHLRIGEALLVPYDLLYSWDCPIEGLSNNALVLKAQIIEINCKPTKPLGQQGINCFGSYREYENLGIRKRAILGIGEYDFGSYDKLIPKDSDIRVLGASSDHTIIDIQDSKKEYQLGDIVEFQLRYQSMLFSTANPMVIKQVITNS